MCSGDHETTLGKHGELGVSQRQRGLLNQVHTGRRAGVVAAEIPERHVRLGREARSIERVLRDELGLQPGEILFRRHCRFD